MSQGKRKNQLKFITKMLLITLIGVIIILSILKMLYYVFPINENTESMEGPPSNYWVPTNKESEDWTGTTQDIDTFYSDEDVMWIGGNNDTIWE
tara:strand:+ start:1862 stop:2143 length:282 start_codon:yes stop_codon:yes gene_type:complete